jgi:hypothetical protein
MPSEINGLSVGIITVGGLLIYAGIQGKSPLQALRDVSSGKPPPVANKPGTLDGGNVTAVAQGSSVGAAALAAVKAYSGDKYSQPLRTEPGYSDCSSYVCKAFHDVGVANPDGRMPWPNTTAFATAPSWKTIPQAQAVPGDIAVVPAGIAGGHMVFVTTPGGANGLGQQNPHTNVNEGPISQLFAGVRGTPIFRTFVGTTG